MKTELMRLTLPLLIITCASASALEMVGPNASTNEGKGNGLPGPGGMPMGSMSRPAMAFEVELVVIKGDLDQAGLARWAELAAAGYRLTQVTNDGGKQWVYLERAVLGAPATLRLPAVVEQDHPVAEALRVKIQAALSERLQALRGQPPVSVSPAPVTK